MPGFCRSLRRFFSSSATIGIFFFRFFLFYAASVHGEPHFYIEPLIKAEYLFQRNFFAAEENLRPIHTFLLQHRLKLGAETPKSQHLIDFSLQDFRYRDQGEISVGVSAHEDDYLGYKGKAMFRYLPFPRLVLSLDDQSYRVRNRVQSDKSGNPIPMNKNIVNSLTPGIWYVYEPYWIIGLEYERLDVSYDRPHHEDSESHTGSFGISYSFTRTDSLGITGDYAERDFDHHETDYRICRIEAIYRKQWAHLSFESGTGFEHRYFRGEADDIDTKTARMALMWQQPSPPVPMPRNHIPRTYVFAVVKRDLDDTGSEEEYFRSTTLSLRAGHTFTGKMVVDAYGSLTDASYLNFSGNTTSGETVLREDREYRFISRIGYSPSYGLHFFFNTGMIHQNSNLTGFNYRDYFFGFGIEFKYRYCSRKYTGIVFEPDLRLDLYNRRL